MTDMFHSISKGIELYYGTNAQKLFFFFLMISKTDPDPHTGVKMGQGQEDKGWGFFIMQ